MNCFSGGDQFRRTATTPESAVMQTRGFVAADETQSRKAKRGSWFFCRGLRNDAFLWSQSSIFCLNYLNYVSFPRLL